jgi:hypothetical protein
MTDGPKIPSGTSGLPNTLKKESRKDGIVRSDLSVTNFRVTIFASGRCG